MGRCSVRKGILGLFGKWKRTCFKMWGWRKEGDKQLGIKVREYVALKEWQIVLCY